MNSNPKCQRCGKEYVDPKIWVCSCHPMFSKGWGAEVEPPIEFKTSEDAERCIAWINSLFSLHSTELKKKIEGLQSLSPERKGVMRYNYGLGGYISKDDVLALLQEEEEKK